MESQGLTLGTVGGSHLLNVHCIATEVRAHQASSSSQVKEETRLHSSRTARGALLTQRLLSAVDKVRRAGPWAPAPALLLKPEVPARQVPRGRQQPVKRAKACVFSGALRRPAWAWRLILWPVLGVSAGQWQGQRSKESRLSPGSQSKAKRPLGVSVVLRGRGWQWGAGPRGSSYSIVLQS